MTTLPRRFHLQRDHDVSGVSGTGRVADGVLWPDGTATLRWRGDRASTVHWDRITDTEHVHGHGGATRIVWDDPAAHAGGNAEDCPACSGANLPYPFICPGPATAHIPPQRCAHRGAHPGFTCAEVDASQPYFRVQWEQQAPPADEDTHRTARRDSAVNLLARLSSRGYLSEAETALLQQHVEAEIREADTARAVAAGNLRHVRTLVPELEAATAAVERVRALHVPRDNGTCAARCYSTGMAPEPHPCPTIHALNGPAKGV